MSCLTTWLCVWVDQRGSAGGKQTKPLSVQGGLSDDEDDDEDDEDDDDDDDDDDDEHGKIDGSVSLFRPMSFIVSIGEAKSWSWPGLELGFGLDRSLPWSSGP